MITKPNLTSLRGAGKAARVNIKDGIAWTVDSKSVVRWCCINLPDCVVNLEELIAAIPEQGRIINGKLHLGSAILQTFGPPPCLPIDTGKGFQLCLGTDIEWVKKAAGTDTTSPTTFGVYISKECQLGLDGHRMHIVKQSAGTEYNLPDFRVHPAAFTTLKNTVVINKSSVDKPDHGVHYPVISEPYPPFENVLNAFIPTNQTVIQDTTELINGLKKAKKLAKKDSWVILSFGEQPNTITIKTEHYNQSIYWEQSGEPFDIFVNINYLVDALWEFPMIKISKKVETEINGDQVVIEYKNCTAMIMGVRRDYMKKIEKATK